MSDFANTVKVDHDYGSVDALRYLSPGGSPIENAQIRVYLKSEYASGKLDTPISVTTTDLTGRWKNPILTEPGNTYVVRFDKAGAYGPDTREIIT